MERSTLIRDLAEFVDKAQQNTSTNPLEVCIEELKGILLKHLEQSEGSVYENLR